MSNLTTIKELAASVKQKLAALTINPAKLDNIDTVASERAVLQEKLNLLADAEATERERLLNEKAAQQAKKRRLYLLGVAIKGEKLVERYNTLTEEVKNLCTALIKTLDERENIFTQQSTDLSNPIRYELLTNDEFKLLLDAMERSATRIYAGEFTETFREAINNHVESSHIRTALRDLVPANQPHHKVITGARPFLANAAREMSETDYTPDTDTVKTVSPEPMRNGTHFQVDLRESGSVTNLNEGAIS